MRRAPVYARYNSENQQEASLADQIRAAKASMEAHGWTMVETYAIADGLRTLGLKRQLEALEAEQQELERQVQAEPVSMPQSHPNLARFYREKVSAPSAALSDP